tara:strand:+ start:493 stop:2835 length:2343 start_codon:yes stop_codon:yes gene_type:complete
MKQKIIILIVLLGLTSLIYITKNGVFNTKNSDYSDLKLPDIVDYNFHIKPIISDNCYTCHGPDANKRKAGLQLDIKEGLFGELPENPGKFSVVPNNVSKSSFYKHIMSGDPDEVMPPVDSKLSLNSYEKKLIKKWIQQGAPFAKHWAFISPEKAVLPENINKDWEQNEIDAFVLKKIEDNDLSPSAKAKREILIRRISLDLTGLPPKPEHIKKLTDDLSNEGLSKIIDEFFALPSYGERMAQSWLDIARFADSHGYQDDSYRTMWPWRDWVIHAFNKNLPYDEFLTYQLAGDLLPNATKEQILATGFNRNHPITQEGGSIQEEYRSYYVADRTNTLGKGILGLTLECAKCHDHKYDPLSQKNYYEFYSFFNQVDEKGIQMDAVQARNRKYFADSPFIKLTDKLIEEELPFVNKKLGDTINVMIMNDSAPKSTYVLNRGNYDDPSTEVKPNTPTVIYPFSEGLPKNRLGLANWVTDEKNPLTARVFVNRIWGLIFGDGLVVTAEDFGAQGSLPTHPALLDWLARDFMEHDWDVQHLLKKIMLSATYQQSSEMTPELKKADPENKLLARASRFRMSGEMIRDYVLTTSGLLNTEIGGPSVKPYQPPGLWEEVSAGVNRGVLSKYVQDEGDKLYRRSLYTLWKRTLPPPSMTIFDAPNRDFCEVRRQKTNTPLQALALQNDVQMLEAARVLAQQMVAKNQNDVEMLSDVFQRILVRQPDENELKVLQQYFTDARDTFRDNKENAEKLLTQGNFEKADTDPIKTAALMLTAQVIYNLDETITKE